MKKKYYLLCIAVALLLIISGFLYIKSTRLMSRNITVALNIFPPFTMEVGTTGNFTGFDVDILREIAKSQKLNLTFKKVEFDNILAGIQTGKYNMGTTFTILPDREEIVGFSWPCVETGLALAVNADNRKINSVDDLKDQALSTFTGTGAMQALKWKKEGRIKDFRILNCNIENIYQDILSNKIDVCLSDHAVNKHFAGKFNGKIKCLEKLYTYEYFGFPLHKTDEDLRARLNRGLKELFLSGKYAEIHKKYFK